MLSQLQLTDPDSSCQVDLLHVIVHAHSRWQPGASCAAECMAMLYQRRQDWSIAAMASPIA